MTVVAGATAVGGNPAAPPAEGESLDLSNSQARWKDMSFRLGLRVSAAGVLMGLSLAGPQALGVAFADDTDSGATSASAGAP